MRSLSVTVNIKRHWWLRTLSDVWKSAQFYRNTLCIHPCPTIIHQLYECQIWSKWSWKGYL